MPKFWPMPKTGNKYLAVPSHEQRNSMPLIIVVRDMLKLVKNKKELQDALNKKSIEVNGKAVIEKNYPVALFDSVSITPANKHYRAVLNNKRMDLAEIKKEDIGIRICKVIGKKTLAAGKTQLNLNLGRNIISDNKIKVGDFVLMDVIKNKILKAIPLEKETKIVIVKGKHIGKNGKIRDLSKEGDNLIAKIKISSGEEISSNVNNLFASE